MTDGCTGNAKILTELGKCLFEAARLGKPEEVKELMKSGAPLISDWLGTTPLHLASIYGHHETADILIKSGISRDCRTKVDKVPLHFACQHGHIEIARILIDGGAHLNAVDMLNMTPLHWAVEANNLEICILLLKAGVKTLLRNKFSKTPLTIARDKGYDKIEKLLAGEKLREIDEPDVITRHNAYLDKNLNSVKIYKSEDNTNNTTGKKPKTRRFPMVAGTWTGGEAPNQERLEYSERKRLGHYKRKSYHRDDLMTPFLYGVHVPPSPSPSTASIDLNNKEENNIFDLLSPSPISVPSPHTDDGYTVIEGTPLEKLKETVRQSTQCPTDQIELVMTSSNLQMASRIEAAATSFVTVSYMNTTSQPTASKTRTLKVPKMTTSLENIQPRPYMGDPYCPRPPTYMGGGIPMISPYVISTLPPEMNTLNTVEELYKQQERLATTPSTPCATPMSDNMPVYCLPSSTALTPAVSSIPSTASTSTVASNSPTTATTSASTISTILTQLNDSILKATTTAATTAAKVEQHTPNYVKVSTPPTTNFVTIDPQTGNYVKVDAKPTNFLKIEQKPTSYAKSDPQTTTSYVRVDPQTGNYVKVEPKPTNYVKVDPQTTNLVKVDPHTGNFVKMDPQTTLFRVAQHPSGGLMKMDPPQTAFIRPPHANLIKMDPQPNFVRASPQTSILKVSPQKREIIYTDAFPPSPGKRSHSEHITKSRTLQTKTPPKVSRLAQRSISLPSSLSGGKKDPNPTIPINIPVNMLNEVLRGVVTLHSVPVKPNSGDRSMETMAGITSDMGTVPWIPVSGEGGLQLVPLENHHHVKSKSKDKRQEQSTDSPRTIIQQIVPAQHYVPTHPHPYYVQPQVLPYSYPMNAPPGIPVLPPGYDISNTILTGHQHTTVGKDGQPHQQVIYVQQQGNHTLYPTPQHLPMPHPTYQHILPTSYAHARPPLHPTFVQPQQPQQQPPPGHVFLQASPGQPTVIRQQAPQYVYVDTNGNILQQVSGSDISVSTKETS